MPVSTSRKRTDPAERLTDAFDGVITPNPDEEDRLNEFESAPVDDPPGRVVDASARRKPTVVQGPDGVQRNPCGAATTNLANVVRVLEIDPGWRESLRFNSFALRIEAVGGSPVHGEQPGKTIAWDDAADKRSCVYLQRNVEWQAAGPSACMVADAIEVVARQREYHPLRDYLDACAAKWDGTPRIRLLLPTYFAVEDSDYSRCVGEKFLRSAVARIFDPGCKADHMLILESRAQGMFKSMGAKILAGEWFTDELPDLRSKDAAIQLLGRWIIEGAELDTMGRSEASTFKAFTSRTADVYRPPYGRRTIEVPRQNVFIGTTNGGTYLRDDTGNRRVWPVKCLGKVKVDELARDRDQLWGEAVMSYREGKSWWFEDESVPAAEQDARFVTDVWESQILPFIERRRAVGVTVGEILGDVLSIAPKDMGRREDMRVASILVHLHWERRRFELEPIDGKRQREWRYVPTQQPEPNEGDHE